MTHITKGSARDWEGVCNGLAVNKASKNAPLQSVTTSQSALPWGGSGAARRRRSKGFSA